MKITEDILKNDTDLIVAEQILMFMLEMLKAYDEQEVKSKELLDVAEKYCNWLIENTEEQDEIMILNRFQIIRRKRDLNDSEKLFLNEFRKKENDLSLKCAACILLGKNELAQDYFDDMKEADKESFINYPICSLGNIIYLSEEQ